MLILTRKIDEQLRIGDAITITIVGISGGQVRIGIEAPRDVRVLRSELEPRYAPVVRTADAEPLKIGTPAATPPLTVKKKP